MEQGEKRQIKETDENRAAGERCFTCEARNYLSTVTTAAAAPALPQLLRHFVLLSHTDTHSLTHTSSHMRSPSLSVLIPPPPPSLYCFLSNDPSLLSSFVVCYISPLLALSQHLPTFLELTFGSTEAAES